VQGVAEHLAIEDSSQVRLDSGLFCFHNAPLSHSRTTYEPTARDCSLPRR
jgi:hypothetical protein